MHIAIFYRVYGRGQDIASNDGMASQGYQRPHVYIVEKLPKIMNLVLHSLVSVIISVTVQHIMLK